MLQCCWGIFRPAAGIYYAGGHRGGDRLLFLGGFRAVAGCTALASVNNSGRQPQRLPDRGSATTRCGEIPAIAITTLTATQGLFPTGPIIMVSASLASQVTIWKAATTPNVNTS